MSAAPKITYIYHSGFLIETNDYYLLFDYFKGTLPALDTKKPILVFSSHTHQDHFNPYVFTLLKEMNMQHITAVLSKDIKEKLHPQDLPVFTVRMHQSYELPCEIWLDTLQSTDAGVAFLLTTKDGIFFHSGDLNDWVWEGETAEYNRHMTGSFRHEIKLLKELLNGRTIDTAFFPLDPRLEKTYCKGFLYFLENVPVREIIPMHYWEKPEMLAQFLKEYPQYKAIAHL